ncbi:hypothetical protein E5288_WYG014148 [Bos mutus]|uniref:Uncharacterized protein n=1 Tax=Bos mutus TaxID=72004 RepID=A0A6B0R6Y7_9CETA|nr:hypothetical protein [Bos mutus]
MKLDVDENDTDEGGELDHLEGEDGLENRIGLKISFPNQFGGHESKALVTKLLFYQPSSSQAEEPCLGPARALHHFRA